MSRTVSLRTRILLGVVALIGATASDAVPPDPPGDNSLYTWRSSRAALRDVALLIAERKYRQADTELLRFTGELPLPYRNSAIAARNELHKALATVTDSFGRNKSSGKMLEAIVPNDKEAVYRYETLGSLCKRLDAPREAADFYWRAVRLKADASDVRDLLLMLTASRADDKAFADLDKLLTKRGRKKEWHEAIEEARSNSPPEDEDLLRWLASPNERIRETGLPLEELHRLLLKAKTGAQRLEIYSATIRALDACGDRRGRDAWEEKLLVDFRSNVKACSTLYVSRGERAYGEKRYQDALRNFRAVCIDYPDTEAYGVAQFNVGAILQQQRKYDEAIAEFTKLIPSNVNDQDSSGNIMAPFRNYRNSAAKCIAACYEKKRDYAKALEWVGAASAKYRVETFCGNCAETEKASLAIWKAKLLDRLGRSDEALRLVEPMVFQDAGYPSAAFLTVDIYDRRHKLDQLEARIAAASKENKASDEKLRTAMPGLQTLRKDGMTYAMKAASEYIDLRKMALHGDIAGLWAVVEQSPAGAFETIVAREQPTWQLVEAVASLEKMPDKLIPFLRAKLDGPPHAQGWAFVLLARMKAPDVLPRLKQACNAVDELRAREIRERHQAARANAAQQKVDIRSRIEAAYDLAYALVLLDNPDAKSTLEGYLKRPRDVYNPMGGTARGVVNTLKTAKDDGGGE